MKTTFLRQIGVYGFNDIEPLILASLVSEDPILLIGLSGTGKTYLLNSISEALGLNHKHYNASLLSFDDLIGFPFPSTDQRSIEFLPTPATIWDAESVLIDELSRCKPEIQNKFFSIVHERKIQGIALHSLRYRWAAMNPLQTLESDMENYAGSQALDPALADRFAFILDVPDWLALNEADQEAVVWPAGEGALSDDAGTLRDFVTKARSLFEQKIKLPDYNVIIYSRLVTSFLHQADIRISPRRARLMARNLVALLAVCETAGTEVDNAVRDKLFKLALFKSIPQRAYSNQIEEHKLEAAHAEAIRFLNKKDPNEQWLSSFLLDDSLERKAERLLLGKANKETKSLGLIQFCQKESKERIALMGFVLFPLLLANDIVNEDALNVVARVARPMMLIDGTIDWRQTLNNPNRKHPQWTTCLQYIDLLKKDAPRQQRAKQFFLYLIKENLFNRDPLQHEVDLNNLYNAVANIAQEVFEMNETYMASSLRELPPLTPEQEAEINTYELHWRATLTQAARKGQSIKETYERNKTIDSLT